MTQQESKNALHSVLMRNTFYYDHYRTAQCLVALMVIINLLLIAILFYRWFYPPEPQYFPTTPDGKLIIQYPLNKPVKSDSFVIQWSANAVSQAFNWDYEHWRAQLERSSDYFTEYGWKGFSESLQSSNNLKTLVAKKMVSSATLTGAPQILRKAVINNRYAWKISMPLLVRFTSANDNITIPMHVIAILVRTTTEENPSGIAINNFIAAAQGGST